MSGIEKFYRQFGFRPYKHQEKCHEKILNGENTILDAGTGAGKTEAALLPILIGAKQGTKLKTILIYPTKALIEDQKNRIDEIIKKLGLMGYRAEIDTGDETDKTYYRANIILTTIDKFLYRIFGYGNARWGFIYPWKIVFNPNYKRALIFDEAHLYDGVSLTHLLFLLEKLSYENNLQTIVLSATLPAKFKEYLEKNFDFECVHEGNDVKKGKQVYKGHIEEKDVQSKISDAYFKDKRVVVVANRVYGDGNSVKNLWEKLNTGLIEYLFVYHGHQFPDQRKKVLEKIISIDKSWKENKIGKPFVLLTTSAFEVGVDISCDVMLTEVCPSDSFIQRIGRCGRQEGEIGEVYTFGEIEKQPEDIEKIQQLFAILKENDGKEINALIKNKINELNVPPTSFESYKRNLVYAMDSGLYRYIYDFVPTEAEVWDKGILLTRNWIPTLEIEYHDRDKRLRLPIIHSIPAHMIVDWWLEYRDEYGKIKYAKDPNDLRKNGIVVRSVSLRETRDDKKRTIKYENCIQGLQATLVLKLAYRDETFGLDYRTNTEVKRGYGGIGLQIRVASINVNDGVVNLFWYEPEGNDVHTS